MQNHSFTHRSIQSRRLDYLVSLPDGYDEPAQRPWPLIVFLHGAGERGGTDNILKAGLMQHIADGLALPCVVVAPACPEGEWWLDKLDLLDAWLDNIIEAHAVDRKRVYLTGLSMGGNGAWHWAIEQPDRFAALVPVCGFGIGILIEDRMQRLNDMPIWTFHGEDDAIVPITATEELVAGVEAAGGSAQFTRYPGVAHNSWDRAYSTPDLYDWMLRHART